MKKSAEILGLPIISITEGRELGMSKTLVIDAKNGLIAAITIEDEEWYRGVKLIPYSSIIAIGDDAITILHSDKILKLGQIGNYEPLLVENIRILETKAITKTGKIMGRVADIFVGEDGKIEKCEIRAADGSTSEVSADKISIFSRQVTVIDMDGVKKSKPVVKPVESTEIKPEPVAVVEEKPAEVKPVEEIKPVEEVKPVEIPAPVPEVETKTEEIQIENPVEEIPPVENVQPVETVQNVEDVQPVEEISDTEDSDEDEVEMPDLEDFEPEPANKVEVATEPEKKTETKGIQQAEALKAALKRAMEKQQKNATPATKTEPKKGGKTVTLVGRKVTKTITANNGSVIIEEGGEITEEILQKARIAGKFIELSMNSIA